MSRKTKESYQRFQLGRLMCIGDETKMSDINARIGKKLQELRESKNLSLNDVGLKVGKARNTIHAYEKGKIVISVDALNSICNALDCCFVDLLNEVMQDINK